MPPRAKFTRGNVIQSAFEIVKKRGIDNLTARKIAEKLKSSTAPVYCCFESMSELEREVIGKAKDLLFWYAIKPYTEKAFLNMGTGIVLFARDHRKLFLAIFREKSDFRDIRKEFANSFEEEMMKDSRFAEMPSEDKNAILAKIWIFIYGLAAIVCAGLVEDDSEEHIIDMLSDMSSVVIDAELKKSQEKISSKINGELEENREMGRV